MNRTVALESEFDELLIGGATAIRAEGKTPSRIRLIRILRDQTGLSLIKAGKAVDDFAERGVLQKLFGPGPYDAWLTAELEKARRLNKGINNTTLAKKLQHEGRVHYAAAGKTKLSGIAKSLLGLADAIDIVDDYLLRYGLKPVLGPYPFYGIIIVVITEAILFLPVLFIVHFALGYLLSGRPLTPAPFAFFFLLFLAERVWKNWRKLRSSKRWSSYDDARDRLPH